MKLNHVISTNQFLDTGILNEIFDLASSMEKRARQSTLDSPLAGKILATVFYEPSTRTRLSFESAMQRLGGSIISTESAGHFSSAAKGETLEDSIRVIAGYADAIVLRHPEKGSAKKASEVSPVPIINAGDGPGDHPTQALLDLYTIQKEFGAINDLTIAFVGDTLYSRTIHSLVHLLTLYPIKKVYLVSPISLRLPGEYKRYIEESKIPFEEITDLTKILTEVDIIYMTRIQKERFASQEEYEKLKDTYVIGKDTLAYLKENARIMDPLPRVGAISSEIDTDERAAYFRQAKNGLYVRMALLAIILG